MTAKQTAHAGFLVILSNLLLFSVSFGAEKKLRNQYEFEDIVIPGAHAEESKRAAFSLKAALDYIEQGATAWAGDRACISCHTTGSYLFTRPALSPYVGKPSPKMHEFFVKQLDEIQKEDREKLSEGITPTQIAYLAAGLAEWDEHITQTLSSETDAALRLMFDVQSEDGSFSNIDCWPPLESSNFHGATVAAMAASTAPGWLKQTKTSDPSLINQFEKLKRYLRQTRPPHDYARVLLLWAVTRLPNLIEEERRETIIEMIRKHQRPDGGWSLRSFGSPASWGGGSRAEKLRAEPDRNKRSSDGHMTGLAVLVLRDAGVAKTDLQLKKAVHWLKTNQRESGRWWTRSLNTDKFHFITYSGTCYPILALAKCGELE
ncbi:MAG TPA: hypothetical protein EYQ50_22230 [Verrucomicrobiales bacterium]|nr:hypothetical protein [Verrucomicrobiales bacterium]HIL70537.1 hypothetical protein [Verrucomicrobiota bacterium]